MTALRIWSGVSLGLYRSEQIDCEMDDQKDPLATLCLYACRRVGRFSNADEKAGLAHYGLWLILTLASGYQETVRLEQ